MRGFTFLIMALFSMVIDIEVSKASTVKEITQEAKNLKCTLAFTKALSRTPEGTLAQQFLCFRDEESYDGKAIFCALRQYDGKEHIKVKLALLPGSDTESNTLMSDTSCETGGIMKVLAMPVSESRTGLDIIGASYLNYPNLVVVVGNRFKPEIKLISDQAGVYSPPIHRDERKAQGGEPEKVDKVSRHIVKVFYATDRKYVPNESPAQTFTNDRNTDGSLALGTVQVSIPLIHKEGQLETKNMFKLTFTNLDKLVVMQSVQKISTDAFYSEIQNKLNGAKRKDAFVFIHGYNTTFEDAARRTAQISFDMGFDGAPIFYSWPSGDQIWKYLSAESNVDWSFRHLAGFLQDLVHKSRAQNIYLIAHSMGNRTLTSALNLLAEKNLLKPSKAFRHVILTAPDIDAAVFKEIASSVSATTNNLTLYASDNDKAIHWSQRFHDYRRLGQAGPDIVSLPFMDSIDASDANYSFFGVDHSYFATSDTVLDDIRDIIKSNKLAAQRNLIPKSGVSGPYWKFPRP